MVYIYGIYIYIYILYGIYMVYIYYMVYVYGIYIWYMYMLYIYMLTIYPLSMVKLYKTGFYTHVGRWEESMNLHTQSAIPSDDHKPYTLHTQCFDRGIAGGSKVVRGVLTNPCGVPEIRLLKACIILWDVGHTE